MMEFINLKAQYSYMKSEIDASIQEVLQGGKYILSSHVKEFEERLAEYVGRRFTVTCGNGTDALQMIFLAYGIGKGDIVFCPDMTFIASIESAVMLGAKPVFCDIDENSYNISINSLEKKIQEVISEGKYIPKAIIAVDFLGNPIKYRELQSVAKEYNLLLVEDAAQGMGAGYENIKCGAMGDISATSFFPTKPLGCYGDGGAVFTDDKDMYLLLQSLRAHGRGKNKYDNIRIGINSRLDELQAAILSRKLLYLEDEIKIRQKIAARYTEELKEIVVVPNVTEGGVSSYAQYIILLRNAEERGKLEKGLNLKGIPTIYYYPNPLHKLPVFCKYGYDDKDFPNTISYAERAIGIPFSPYLTEEEQGNVIRAIKQIL
ncbi:UDP-2-acetamido-2-deoxy-3-oxo-D-glucuronate aminotransferase [Lachnospiraceae bacterium]|nr:UDP-2-acetamido-2-deoxy-3-oxo-D-glucuronate aminotransferase [Lachnospiraceae bacterium]